MTPPAARRYIRLDDGELNDVAGMSAEEQKEWTQIQIMRGDLSQATADGIKYSVRRDQQRTSNFIVPRQCDRRDTKEAEIASKNKPQLSNWNSFHTTVEEPDLPGGEARNLHGHRAKIRQELREEAVNLGLNSVTELSLEDTYDHPRGHGRGNKQFPPANRGSKAPFPSTKRFAAVPLPQSKGPPRGKRGKAEQARPWPPAALLGAPGVAPVTKQYVTTAKSPTKKLAGMPAAGQIAAKARPVKGKAPSVSPPWKANLATPTDFMSAVTSQFSQKVDQKSEQPVVPNINGGENIPATPSAEVTQDKNPEELSDLAIRRVSVQEFSFSALGALAPGEIDTHTDGALTPGTLSGFSTSTEIQEQVSVQAEPQNGDLIGLGVENVDFDKAPAVLEIQTSLTAPAQVVGFSPSGSIMDSPILDDVKSDVLAAEPGNILEFAGRKYIALDDLLALRDAIEKKISAATANGITGSTTHSEPAVAASAQSSSVPSATTSSEASTVIPAARTNPFAPREPLASSNANFISTSTPIAEAKKNLPDAELGRPSTARRPAPVASNTKIYSKWGDDPPPTAIKKDVPAAEPAKSTHTSRAGPLTSNTQIYSKWASEPQSAPAPRGASTTVRPKSPIFGDRKAFGHLSEEARKGQQYTPLSTKPVSKQKAYMQPGPGYAWLLQEIAAMKIDDDSNK